MKKNFFKKLSFVLALAMIVTALAPAAGAFAAAAPKLNATKKYLHLSGVPGSNEYDFNIANKGKGWKYDWSSANEAVAVVDEMGVATATGVGTTKVTVVIADKDGEEVAELSATVVVRDNIKTVDIANAPTDNKLKVNESFDFNRTFTTQANSTKKTSSVTRWSVDKAGATITDAGVFTATEAGKYVVTARAFQSTAKYDAWKALNDPASTLNVLATDTVEVTVNVAITAATLLKPNQIKLTFDSSVKELVKAKSDVTVSLKLSDNYTAMVPVWSLDKVSDDGKEVTISTYDALADKQTYVINAAGAKFDLYAQIGKPVSISMDDQTIAAGTATALTYTLLDQYGVNVASLFDGTVNKNSSVPLDVNKKLTLANDQVSFVEYNYLIINSDGTTKTISTGTKTVRGVAATVTGSLEWNVYDSEDFSKTTKTIKIGETGKELYGRIKKSDGTYTPSTNYRYVSMTESILLVDAVSDLLIPIAAGTALVKVEDVTTSPVSTVGYINVEVLAAPAVASIKADAVSFVLSNNISGTPGQKVVTVKTVDQYGTEANASGLVVTAVSATTPDFLQTPAVSGNQVTFTAVLDKTGSVTYTIKDSNNKTIAVTVSVVTPGILNSYVIETSAATLDSYTANTSSTPASLTFNVFGVDANGVKKQAVLDAHATSGAAVSYVIKNSEGTIVQGTTSSSTVYVNAADIAYAVNDNDGTVEKNGTYTITVTIGGIAYSKNFEVKNTRPAPVATIKALSVNAASGTSLVAAVGNLIGLKIGSSDVTIAGVTVSSSNSQVVGNLTSLGDVTLGVAGTAKVFIGKVSTTNGGYTHEVAINQTFTVNVQ